MSRVRFLLLLGAAACSFPAYSVAEPVPVASCHDGLLSLGELDVDCGPACNATCNKGQVCSTDEECQSGFCQAGKCAMPSAPSCSNGARDATETDVDCGGTDGCAPCATGKRCESSYDCNLARCNAGFCQAQSCSDGLQNQDESDVDCGGSTGCDRCVTKQHCATTADCEESSCSQGLCQPQGCDDGVKNGDETAGDCGGSCVPCAEHEACTAADDCLSLSCDAVAGFCLPATCEDGILNGHEPSLDCGASCVDKACEMTKSCVIDGDCQSGKCHDMRCMPAAATGAVLSNAGWLASASETYQASVPFKAIDGNPTSFWESGKWQYPGMWFQIDMLESRPFFAVELVVSTNGDWPRHIRLAVSEDGQTFTAATGTLSGSKSMRFDVVNGRIARYLRLEITGESGGLWWRIDELRVLQ